MSNYLKRLPLMRRSAQVADPGEMVDLRMEEGSWRQGFMALFCAPSTAETGEVLIWVCTEDEYRQARSEDRRAVGMTWPAKRMRVSPSPTPGAYPTGTGERGVECGRLGYASLARTAVRAARVVDGIAQNCQGGK